ncbi:hypothetical protein [Streptosporangium sp. NPDC006007]|uniref:hypothetical protein n=1 Tax=Streptosporangium sp. NPDC006007 TaxID=3154575 RepID=UPI0033BE1554
MSTLEGWGGYLARLAWELDELGFDSVVRFPPGRRPSLEIFAPPGRPRVRSTRWGRTSVFTWLRNRDRDALTGVRNAFERIAEVAW